MAVPTYCSDLQGKGIAIKLFLLFFLVIQPASPVHSQDIREDIKQAIKNWYSKSGHGQLVGITKVGQAHPSKEFIDKYAPKETYCVICRKTGTLTKVRVMLRFGRPPLSEEIISQKAYESNDHHIAVITQSGEIDLINDPGMPPFLPPPPPMPCKVKGAEPKSKAQSEAEANRETKFHSLWRETCPFSWESLKDPDF